METVDIVALSGLLGLPFASVVALACILICGRQAHERAISGIALTCLTGSWCAALVLALRASQSQAGILDLRPGSWFVAGSYHFELTFLIDHLSIVMLLLSTSITLLVAKFSVRYLHREPGFARFFFLVSLFATGILLLSVAGSFDIFFAGWEFVGISSFLLVGFFSDRSGPARGSLRTILTYRMADLGLLVSGILLHHHLGSSAFADVFGPSAWPHALTPLPESAATLIALALFLSAAGKSALLPFSGWLPRAMEGPTPSSALFYGALSVHAGAFLMLRAAPLLEAAPFASHWVTLVGGLTALYATLVGRTSNDVKCQLAWATATQLGLIFMAIGLHWWYWAIFHMVGHVVLRTYQFLRVPSALHDALNVRAALGRTPAVRRSLAALFVPIGLRDRLQVAAHRGFFLDDVLDRLVIAPVVALSLMLDRAERGLVQRVAGYPATSPPQSAYGHPIAAADMRPSTTPAPHTHCETLFEPNHG